MVMLQRKKKRVLRITWIAVNSTDCYWWLRRQEAFGILGFRVFCDCSEFFSVPSVCGMLCIYRLGRRCLYWKEKQTRASLLILEREADSGVVAYIEKRSRLGRRCLD
ncbi:hypothetical protein QL285_014981 [Trifolium repens]|nr:hypothetical protein QL285_014981 [Trifolium repens]